MKSMSDLNSGGITDCDAEQRKKSYVNYTECKKIFIQKLKSGVNRQP